MNVFFLDQSPISAAQALCDKHAIKMALECAQLLATSYIEQSLGQLPKSKLVPIVTLLSRRGLRSKQNNSVGIREYYKITHKEHPCTRWAKESRANMAWVVAHGLAICGEYTRRYGKVHGSEWPLCIAAYKLLDETGEATLADLYYYHSAPAQAMPKCYQGVDPVMAYRNYYAVEKRSIAAWRLGNVPNWFNSSVFAGSIGV